MCFREVLLTSTAVKIQGHKQAALAFMGCPVNSQHARITHMHREI